MCYSKDKNLQVRKLLVCQKGRFPLRERISSLSKEDLSTPFSHLPPWWVGHLEPALSLILLVPRRELLACLLFWGL